MSSLRTYTMAGITTQNGQTIYRFGTGDFNIRLSVFERSGCTDIKFFELPNAMTKDEAVKWLNEHGYFAVMPKVGRKPGAVKRSAPRIVPVPVAAPTVETHDVTNYMASMADGETPAADDSQGVQEDASAQAIDLVNAVSGEMDHVPTPETTGA